MTGVGKLTAATFCAVPTNSLHFRAIFSVLFLRSSLDTAMDTTRLGTRIEVESLDNEFVRTEGHLLLTILAEVWTGINERGG